MLERVGRYLFKAEQYQCDVNWRLKLSYLLNLILTAADHHANQRGFGADTLNAAGRTWVLSRLAVEMKRIPSRHDSFFVETWVESVSDLFTTRNFRLLNAAEGAEGEVLGYGISIWAMIDTTTRRPISMTNIYKEGIEQYVTGEGVPIERPNRIAVGEEAKLRRTIEIYFSDIDFNGHINSVKYIDHILDLFPMEWHLNHTIKRVDLAFVAEGKAGVPIEIYSTEPQSLIMPDREPLQGESFKILQGEHHELCRCRILAEVAEKE